MSFFLKFRKFISLLMFASIESICVKESVFRLQAGFKLTEGTILQNVTQQDVTIIGCVRLCSKIPCYSATYSVSPRQCLTYSDKIHDNSVRWTADASWTILYKLGTTPVVKHGDWTLVMRAQKHTNQSVHDRWLATNTRDDNPVSPDLPIHCYRLDTLGFCPRHFRSCILDNWNWSNISQVKLATYTNGTEMNYITFNATGTNVSDWFRRNRIIESSWTSMKNNTLIEEFDILGGIIPLPSKRRFVINDYRGCGADVSYFQIIDTNYDMCQNRWPLSTVTFPQIMYSPFDRMVKIAMIPKEYKFADVVAIFVQMYSP